MKPYAACRTAMLLLILGAVAPKETAAELFFYDPGASATGLEKMEPPRLVDDPVLCVGKVKRLGVQITNGPPNTPIVFEVSQSKSGIVGFSRTQSGSFANALSIPTQTDASGNATTGFFFVKGLAPGETAIRARNNTDLFYLLSQCRGG